MISQRDQLPRTGSTGKKLVPIKIKDLLAEYGVEVSVNDASSHVSKPRSTGKKYQPVKMSNSYIDNPLSSKKSCSSRKTIGVPMRQPIRNISKLLESPKVSARRRLDNLYDHCKPKENTTRSMVNSLALSAKKTAPKNTATLKTPGKQSDKKVDLTSKNEKSCRSRLLPLGTITNSYINQHNSTAQRTSLYKPTDNILSNRKKLQSNRPSNIPEESSWSSEAVNETSGNTQKIDSNSSSNICEQILLKNDAFEEEQKSTKCCQCKRILDDSKVPENISILPNLNVNDIENTEFNMKQNLTINGNNEVQRPTVIVTQKETVQQIEKICEKINESLDISRQKGSCTKISNGRFSNSSEINGTLIFETLESSCIRSESINKMNPSDKMTEVILNFMSMNSQILVTEQKDLTESLIEYEKKIVSLKSKLERVNVLLDKQKSLESILKSNGWSSLNDEELSVLIHGYNTNKKKDLEKPLTSEKPQSSENDKSTPKVDEAHSPEVDEQKSETENLEHIPSHSTGNDNDLAKNILLDAKENIENEPPARRRSARLAMKNANLSISADQNTPAKEKRKSNIAKSKSKPCTPNMNTPKSVKWERRSEKPLREYMALKSAIKFLNTPDSKWYQMESDEQVRICGSRSKTDEKSFLANKLLRDLHDLYSTP